MLKKLCDLFSGIKFTVISGVFLLFSLILMLMKKEVALDPAYVSVIISGYPLLYLAISRLFREKWVSSCLLISMAMAASLAIGEIFAAGEVAFIMSIGAILEDMTVEKAKKGITALMNLSPETARLIVKTEKGTEEKTVPASSVPEGSILRVRPGEKIPADGIVISGETTVNQSVITGEALPQDKEPGSEVFCGTLNCSGSVDIKATGVGENSTVSRLVSMVKEAEKNKAPIERIADKWSRWLVPVALIIAAAAFAFNYFAGMEMLPALKRGVTVLVVFCPCALALATPTSVVAAIGKGSKQGVIIKSGAALEILGRADTVAFDKTGTLTEGRLKVSDIRVFGESFSEEDFISLAASAEEKSEHPLGRAIVKYRDEKGIKKTECENFRMFPGSGISVRSNGNTYLFGNERFLVSGGVKPGSLEKQALLEFSLQGKATVLAAENNKCIGIIALSDVIRKEAPGVIAGLSEMGVKCVLLTGDNKNAAEELGRKLNISDVRSGLLPADKVKEIEKIRAEGRTVCMTGDGVNDAPALKISDAGIAMGKAGSDIAVDAASAVLVQDKLEKLLYLKKLARKTLSTIKFNITASMCINAVAVTLSVLGLLNPVTGALVHNAGSLLVVLNAALLYDGRIK